MKILSYLRWKYRQTTFDDICWWSGAALTGAGFASDNKLLSILGVIVWSCIFANVLFEHYRREYKEFEQEQNKLFETIKNSDQK